MSKVRVMDEPVLPCQHKAFKIWVEKLGYKVKPMRENGFFFYHGSQRGFVTDDYRFDRLAFKLMKEFLEHYKNV